MREKVCDERVLDSEKRIGFIQEFPEYESAKTREIYTHVTSQAIQGLKSSLGDLGF